MPRGIYPRTKEHNKAISDARKGRPRPYLKGIKFSEEHKKNISRKLMGHKFWGKKKHSLETKIKIGLASKGKKHSLGYKHTPEAKLKLSLIRKGKSPHDWTDVSRNKISLANKGKHFSPNTQFKKGHKQPKEWVEIQKKKVSGSNNWNWKGGKVSWRPSVFSEHWNKTRRECYKRDNWTCQKCQAKDRVLQAHHKIPYRYWPESMKDLADELTNLITLCISCHKKEDSDISRKLKEIKTKNATVELFKEVVAILK